MCDFSQYTSVWWVKHSSDINLAANKKETVLEGKRVLGDILGTTDQQF